MLSRLKGIETISAVSSVNRVDFSLDMLSRLKGIETVYPCHAWLQVFSTLDMLSRLKGIETETVKNILSIYHMTFGYAFPFEGN